MKKGLHRTFFSLVHSRRLIYNTCWEGHRMDRNLLELDPGKPVMIIARLGEGCCQAGALSGIHRALA